MVHSESTHCNTDVYSYFYCIQYTTVSSGYIQQQNLNCFLKRTSNFLWHQNNADNKLAKVTLGATMVAQVCYMSNEEAETSQVAHAFSPSTQELEAGS